eukprot:5917895-Pleurochrysis_carterae.AAC.2
MSPRESTATSGMSPIAVARCGLPSTPNITSEVGCTFTRSSRRTHMSSHGWTRRTWTGTSPACSGKVRRIP